MEKIIIAGGTGFIGTALCSYLSDRYEVIVLTRKMPNHRLSQVQYLLWDGKTQGPWVDTFNGALAIINLSGKSVNCRYNAENKAKIYSSRLNTTSAIGIAIQSSTIPPKVWINAASATIYRHSLDMAMTEAKHELGTGFSVDVCKKWESTFYDFHFETTRMICMRTAIVLSNEGSVMDYFSKLVRFGFGGKMGNGHQMFSWIDIVDLCKATEWCIQNTSCNGTYNISSPNPVTNIEFMKALRRKLGYGFGIPLRKEVLEFGAWLIGTETELILKSRYVIPDRLLKEGFIFTKPVLDL